MKRTLLAVPAAVAAALTLTGCKNQDGYRASDTDRPPTSTSRTPSTRTTGDHEQPRWYEDPRYDDRMIVSKSNFSTFSSERMDDR